MLERALGDASELGAAWGESYVRHRRAMTVYALSLTGNEADAADLIQDVLVEMVRRRCSPTNEKAFVMRALRNRAIDLRRRRAGRDSKSLGEIGVSTAFIADASATGAAHSDGEAGRLAMRETAAEVRAALERLTGQQREVVVMRAYMDMSFREIAEALDRPLGTVTSHYARGVEALRACWDARTADAGLGATAGDGLDVGRRAERKDAPASTRPEAGGSAGARPAMGARP